MPVTVSATNDESIEVNARTAWLSLGLIVATLLIYWPAFHYRFLNYDDKQYVYENPDVKAGITGHGIRSALTSAHASNWHPLTWFSHMIDVQLFGMNAGPHHFVNVFFHIVNALLLFWFLRHVTNAVYSSAFVAALFALHPLHVQSVAWVAERKDVLSTFFWLLTLWAYVLYVKSPTRKSYVIVFAAFALGLLSKPMLVTVPFTLLLLDFWPLQRFAFDRLLVRRLIYEKLPLFGLAVLASVITYKVQQGGQSIVSFQAIPLSVRLANAAVSYWTYVGKTVWPASLSVFYPYPRAMPAYWGFAALGLLTVSVVAILAARKCGYLFVGWFWFLGTLVPVIGLVQVGSQSMADRYTYVPLIGLFIIVAWGVPVLFRQLPERESVILGLATVAIVSSMIATRTQLRFWKDSLSLWQHAFLVTSDNYDVQAYFADALDEQGRLDEAIPHYIEAARLTPLSSKTRLTLGNALSRRGKLEEATAVYLQGLKINPNNAEIHNELALTLDARGKPSEAFEHFNEALRLNPNFAEAHDGLGILLITHRRPDEAIAHFSEAVRLKPNVPGMHNNLGNALRFRGRMDEAMAHFREALRLDPKNDTALYNLAVTLSLQGDNEEAVRDLREALRINPSNPMAQSLLARLAKKQ